jgi:hypothetical protein
MQNPTAQEQYEENPSPASQEEDQTNSRETSFEIINHINVDEMKCFSNDLKCKYSSPFEPGHAKSNRIDVKRPACTVACAFISRETKTFQK